MELLVLVLNKREYLEDVLSIMVELGVTGATIVDSEGMGHYLAYKVPLFAGLRQMIGEKSTSKTIFAAVDDKNIVGKLQKALLDLGLDFTQPGCGIVFSVPLNKFIKAEGEYLQP